MNDYIKTATCQVTAPQTKQLPDLKCECCGKPLKRNLGDKAALVYGVVECHGTDYKVCRDCEKVVKWICSKKPASVPAPTSQQDKY